MMKKYYYNSTEYGIKKKQLNRVFAKLRKIGYFARQNFWCCSSCAWAAIPENNSNKVVFYHHQDFTCLKENGECYLSWDGDLNEIETCFNEVDFKVELPEDKEKRIYINFKQPE